MATAREKFWYHPIDIPGFRCFLVHVHWHLNIVGNIAPFETLDISSWCPRPVSQFGLFGLSRGHVVLELHWCFTTRTQLFRTFWILHIRYTVNMTHWVFKSHQTLHILITYDTPKGIARICNGPLVDKGLEISIWWNFGNFPTKNTLFRSYHHTHRGDPNILLAESRGISARQLLSPPRFAKFEVLRSAWRGKKRKNQIMRKISMYKYKLKCMDDGNGGIAGQSGSDGKLRHTMFEIAPPIWKGRGINCSGIVLTQTFLVHWFSKTLFCETFYIPW